MPGYKYLNPVIQSGWFTCWAASTSWWTMSMEDRGRAVMTEEEVMKKFSCDWDQNGAMTLKGLADIFRDPKLQMGARFGNETDLYRMINKLAGDPVLCMDAFPIIIGYNDTNAGGNHVAVLCQFDLDTTYSKFVVMDPAIGYKVRTKGYLASQSMAFAWPKEAGQIA